jgi:hypothetical protein
MFERGVAPKHVLVAAVAAVFAVSVGAAAGAPAPFSGSSRATAVVVKRCKAGERRAVIAGRRTCLRAGQTCARRLDRQYRRYGFRCNRRRLTRLQGSATPPSPLAAPIGVTFHCMWGNYDDRSRKYVLDKMQAAGITWVRIDVSWAAIETGKGVRNVGELQKFSRCVEMSLGYGMRVLAILYKTPGWANGGAGVATPPANPADYADFAGYMAQTYKGKVAAWQLWNEENNPLFWNGTKEQYADLIRPAHDAIKAKDEIALVVLGGLTWNDYEYLRDLYALGAKGSFDVVATHAYQWVATTPPETAPDSSIYWYQAAATVHQVIVDNGDDAAFWFTEVGWSTHENGPEVTENPWATGVDEATQADYLVQAIDYARSNWPWLGVMFVYKERSWPLDGSEPMWAFRQEQGYGLLREDGSVRPVYKALKRRITGK